jgi:hypothetical protein
MRVQPDIGVLIKHALRSGRYASVSSYLRHLVIEERTKAGDPQVEKVIRNPKIGRPKAA